MCKYAFCCIDTAASKHTVFVRTSDSGFSSKGAIQLGRTHIYTQSHIIPDCSQPNPGNVLWQHKSYWYTAQLMTIKWVEKAITVSTKSTSSVLTPNCSTDMRINCTLLRSERLKNTSKTNWIILQPGARELNITVKLNQLGPWQSSS